MQAEQPPTPSEKPATAAETDPVAAAPHAGQRRSALLITFLVVFIDLLGFGIVLPLLPLFGEIYLRQLFAGNPLAIGSMLGLLMSAFSAMQFIFSPLWGRVSDRVGRRPILLLGLIGSVVFYALFGYASDLPAETAALAITLLFAARLGQGIAGATIATAQAVIADSTPPERRKQGMALIGAAFGIGFTFGPLVGFVSLHYFPHHLGSLGYAAALLSLLSLILGWILLPETRQFGQEPPTQRKWFSWHETREVLAMPTVGLLVLVFFLTTMGFSSFEPTLALLNEQILDLKKDRNMLVFAYIGLVLLFTQGFLYRRLARTLSEITFMTYGIVLMGLGLILLAGMVALAQLAPPNWSLLLAGVLVSLTVAVMGFAFLTPSIQALISRRSDPERQGEILGVNQSASALARILGPFFGIVLFHVPFTYHLLPYIFGALVLLAMLLLLPRLHKS